MLSFSRANNFLPNAFSSTALSVADDQALLRNIKETNALNIQGRSASLALDSHQDVDPNSLDVNITTTRHTTSVEQHRPNLL